MGFPVRRTRPGEKDNVLAITGEIDAWIQAQQFPEGQLDSVESERPGYFEPLKSSDQKIIELRNRKSGASISTLARTGKTERAQDSVTCKLLATACAGSSF